MSSIKEWAEYERSLQHKWRKDDQDLHENLEAVDSIESLMRGSLSPIEAAKEVDAIFAKPRDAPATLSPSVWHLPDIVDAEGFTVKHGGAVLWRGLPSWGWIFYEHGIDIDYPEGRTDQQWLKQAPALLNATHFAAKLFKDPSFRDGMGYHADRAFREGLEKAYDIETREVERAWRMYIPPAVTWVMTAGDILFNLSLDNKTAKNVSYGHSVERFNPERWSSWKNQFRALAERSDIEDDIRDLATRAAHEMERLEKDQIPPQPGSNA